MNQVPMKKISDFVFSLSDVIGEGFSSSVYKGKHIEKEFPVAIKAIQLKKIANDVQKQLLNNEIKALRSINHPNTIKLFELFQTSNNIYIITELYEKDLASLLKNDGPLSEKHAMSILSQLIQAFIELAEKNIIHRDIKPSNILLKKDLPVVADFGFCEFVDARKENKQFYNVGSPKYMSPEAYKKTIYSHKSDLWGLGMVYLEMLCGKLPFQGLDYDEMIKSIASGKPYSDLKISGFSKMILSRMLSVDLDRRPSFTEIHNLIKSAPSFDQEILRPKSGAIQNIMPQVVRGRTSFYQPTSIDSRSQPKPRQSFRQNSIPQIVPVVKQASQVRPFIQFKNKENQYFPVELKHHWSEKIGWVAQVKDKIGSEKIKSQDQRFPLKIQQLLKVITILHTDIQVRKCQDKIKLLKLLHQLSHISIKKQQEKENGKSVELANLHIILLGYGYLTFEDVGQDKYYNYVLKNMQTFPQKQLYSYIDFWVNICLKSYETNFKKTWNFEQIGSNEEAFNNFLIMKRLLSFSKKLKGEQTTECSPLQSQNVSLELFSEVLNQAESICI